jgi:hypothetical protein
MSAATVVNLARDEPYDVYIGGPGRGEAGYFGNPFAPLLYSGELNREACLALYRRYFRFRLRTDPEFARRVERLRGKRLGCFCAPLPCHGDVIAGHLAGRGGGGE